jgi:hypothetical protein
VLNGGKKVVPKRFGYILIIYLSGAREVIELISMLSIVGFIYIVFLFHQPA